jgi:hypothetical protein
VYSSLASTLDHGGDSDSDAVVRDIPDDNGVSAYDYIIAYCYGPKNFGSGPYVDVVADHGRTWVIYTLKTNNNTVAYATVISKFGVATDYDAPKMIDNKIAADLGFTWQLYAGDDLNAFV